MFTRLFAFCDVLNWSLVEKNVYALKACAIPYPMVCEIFFVTIMINVTASQPAYPPIPNFEKIDLV